MSGSGRLDKVPLHSRVQRSRRNLLKIIVVKVIGYRQGMKQRAVVMTNVN